MSASLGLAGKQNLKRPISRLICSSDKATKALVRKVVTPNSPVNMSIIRRGHQVWIDNLMIAGDRTYAPPEQLYSSRHPDFVVRRIGCDLYLLGNLAAFLFSGINGNQPLKKRHMGGTQGVHRAAPSSLKWHLTSMTHSDLSLTRCRAKDPWQYPAG